MWRRSDLGVRTGGFRRQPPVLAIEVAGIDDTEAYLRDKARWYLDAGVRTVWVVLPETREVLVLAPGHESRHGSGAHVPEPSELAGLSPAVAELFVQLDTP